MKSPSTAVEVSSDNPGVTRGRAAAEADTSFREFVHDPAFPCLGAKSVVRLESYELGAYGSLADRNGTATLARDLDRFAVASADESPGFRAFVAVFPESRPDSEAAFERQLWRQLQLLHDADPCAQSWAPGTSADPDDPHFSFCFGGKAFFVVGLHPLASRIARRFRWPALVFNPRSQFTRLRAEGRFEGLRSTIRARDTALQGTINPSLADFGEQSEARQYSGRKAEADWKCPFHQKAP